MLEFKPCLGVVHPQKKATGLAVAFLGNVFGSGYFFSLSVLGASLLFSRTLSTRP